MKFRTNRPEATTITDRLLMGFLNMLVAAPTGLLLWIALNGFPWAPVPWLSAEFILWFVVIMTILGIIMNDAVLAEFWGKLWRFLVWFFNLLGAGNRH